MNASILKALQDLVEQIDLINPTDELGHDFKMNVAYIKAKQLLEGMKN